METSGITVLYKVRRIWPGLWVGLLKEATRRPYFGLGLIVKH